MDEGKIIFQVTKVGMAVNSKWKVFVDGKYVGDIDFKKDLQVTTSKGQHKVQYKVGAQSTKVLDVNVGDEDVMVECVFDGTVRNFHVIGGTDVSLADVNMNGTNGENVSASIAVANAETKKSKNKLSGLDVFFIIFGVVIVLGIGGALIGSFEEDGVNKENTQVSSGNVNESNNNSQPDFGVSKMAFTIALEEMGIPFKPQKEIVMENSETGYTYFDGNRYIEIAVRANGNVYMVLYSTGEFEYGVGQVSEMSISRAARIFSAVGVGSENDIYSKIYSCILEGDSGHEMEFSGCKVGYSRVMVKGMQTAYVVAR